ncbi:MAG: NAD(P)-dependent alcohol dehydrogenase [Pyrinomonadaceae bacterium]|nr:NAD(P)-dependent alcohol dehydrogenase [Pyrinomonadaceae bacterium]
MLQTKGYAVKSAESSFEAFDFERRELGAKDVLIEIQFCGVCHSDIHQARNEWGNSMYPMVPGHEIVGRVAQIGADVSKFKTDDFAGIGCFVDSCGECENCAQDFEQFCLTHCSQTYNSTEMDKKTPTFGGYSSQYVVDENYALRISDTKNLAAVAPLLCAGITTYSPLKRFNVREGQKVGIIGLGGLGHMGVKFAVSMGAEVTVFSTSPSKEDDARKLGAHNFVVTKEPENMKPLAGKFDFILDTVSAVHDLNMYLKLLKLKGVMVLVGAPEKPSEVPAFSLISNNRTLAGSGIGGIAETQEMLDYCAENDIVSDVEIIPIQQIEAAYERTVKGDVRYRFVIDMQSLNQA